MVGGIEFWIGWIIFAVIVAAWANRRGRNPVAWGTVSIFLSPLVASLALLAVGPSEFAQQPPAPTGTTTDELARWADLRDRGAITDEEYQAKKAALLERS